MSNPPPHYRGHEYRNKCPKSQIHHYPAISRGARVLRRFADRTHPSWRVPFKPDPRPVNTLFTLVITG